MDQEKMGGAREGDGAKKKKPYQSPEIISVEQLEIVAANCDLADASCLPGILLTS